jgi:hypothetical protein
LDSLLVKTEKTLETLETGSREDKKRIVNLNDPERGEGKLKDLLLRAPGYQCLEQFTRLIAFAHKACTILQPDFIAPKHPGNPPSAGAECMLPAAPPQIPVWQEVPVCLRPAYLSKPLVPAL